MSNKYLTFRNVFKDTGTLFKKNIGKLLASILALMVLCILLFLVMALSSGEFDLSNIESLFINMYDADNIPNFIGSILISFAAVLVIMVFYCSYNIRLLYNSYNNENEGLSDFFSIVTKKILPFLGMYLLFCLILVVCFIPTAILAFIGIEALMVIVGIVNYIFVIWVAIGLSFSFVILALEDIKVVDALKASWKLTVKKRGKIFLIGFVTILMIYAAIFIFTAILGVISPFVNFMEVEAFAQSISVAIIIGVILYFILLLFMYPLIFSFNISIFINLKKENGSLGSNELVDDFMVEEKDDYNKW